MTERPFFDVPVVSRGFAELTPAAVHVGRGAAEAAAAALSRELGLAVRIAACARPGVPATAVGMTSVAIALDEVPAMVLLEVDAALAAGALGVLTGGKPLAAALRATAVEQSLFQLLALVAIDASMSTGVAALAPRLVAAGSPGPGALAVDLDITFGDRRGRGRLLIPAAALRALRGPPELTVETAELAIDALYREHGAALTHEDLAALEVGDALLVDAAPPVLVVPGGLVMRGRREDDLFHVEEIRMTEPQASYPVTITVEVGRVTLTLGDLARLSPGATFPLDLRRDGAVVLRVGDRALAHGQLVEIEGALGVRITALGDRP